MCKQLVLHHLRNHIRNSLIKGIWEDSISSRIFDISGKGFCSSDFHIVCDCFFSVFEDSLEHSWKYENIVDLVRIVAATCSDDTDSCFVSELWHDLGSRIRHGKHDSITIHRLRHLECEGSCNRDSYEYISTLDCIRKSTVDIFSVSEFEEFLF